MPEWAAAAKAYKAAKEELRPAQESAAMGRKRLTELAEHPRVAGPGVTVTRYWQDGRIDYAAVPELQDVQLDKYRAPRTQQVRITTEDDEDD